MSDKSLLISGKPLEQPPESGENRLLYDKEQTQRAKVMQVVFIAVVIVMVLLTVALSIYRSVVANEALYILLGVSLLGFVLIQCIMIYFVRSGALEKGKTWFFYFTGLCTILESIFTCVLIFD
ncbi:uncharacterized protein LOC144346273 [Saccoglossus kowalevskii]